VYKNIFFFDNYALRATFTRRRVITTYGSLNKISFKKSMTGNYELYDYQNNDFHNLLNSIGLPPKRHITSCAGHILAVENDQDAVWIKLNHENICNPNKGSKFISLFQNIDLDHIEKLKTRYTEEQEQLIEIQNNLYRVSTLEKDAKNYLTRPINEKFDTYNLLNDMSKVKENVSTLHKTMNDLQEEWRLKIAATQKETINYVLSKQLSTFR